MNRIESALYMVSHLPWPLLLALQVSVVGTIAGLVVRFGLPRNPVWANRMLFLCSIGLLSLPLLHISGGPTVAIEADLFFNSTEFSNSAILNSHGNSSARLGDNWPDSESQATHTDEGATSSNEALVNFENSLVLSENVSNESDSTAAIHNSAILGNSDRWLLPREGYWRLGISIAYGVGCLGLLIRLAIATTRLHFAFAAGNAISDEWTLEELEAAAGQMDLGRLPKIAESCQVSMPLAFGWLPPRILVPTGFAEWTTEERRAVIYHEAAHIARHDLLGELAAQLATIVYWWHPVVWWVAKQMRLSQELATDQRVVAQGFDRAGYARALVTVVARLGQVSNGSRPLCVAMSASSNLNKRVNAILYWSHLASWRRGSLMTLVLLSVIAASSIRVELIAQTVKGDPPPEEPARKNSESVVSIAPPENRKSDLLQRLEDCQVLTVDGDDHAGIFGIAGVVVDSDGNPVSNATVVLRESANMRLNVELQKNGQTQILDGFLNQTRNDVFAKTRTDDAGKFRFENVKAPSTEGKYESGWRGSVVAGLSGVGLGWKNISKTKSTDDFNDKELRIELQPTTEISGTYRSPEGEDLPDELIYLNSVQPSSSSGRDAFSTTELELKGSQLGLTETTSSQGRFSFSGLPANRVASLLVTPPPGSSYQRSLLHVSTGAALREIKVFNRSYKVVSSPAVFVADPGEAILGRVTDESGAGVPDVTIRYQSFIHTFSTDASGRFQIRLPTGSFGGLPSSNRRASIYFTPDKEKTDLLHQRIELDAAQLAIPASIDLQVKLIRGALVTGRVVDSQGAPLADCIVSEFKGLSQSPLGAKIDSDGKFSFRLPLGKHTLVFGSDQSGIDLPSIASLYGIDPARNNIKDWFSREVELTSYEPIELEPVMVRRLENINVSVSLNGKPVSGAKLVIRQKTMSTSEEQVVLSGEDGTAEYSPSTKPAPGAMMEASWSDGQRGYFGSVAIANASANSNNRLLIELKENLLIEGRVTLDGQPWENVGLSIGESAPSSTDPFGGSTVSNHRTVKTDSQGVYRASVPTGKSYAIFIQRLPDQSESPHIGRTVHAQSGKAQVEDFAIETHHHEIAGIAVDRSGIPLAGVRVQIAGNESGFWHWHRDKSQFETDEKGRFHLQYLPEGTHDLLILPPSQTETPNRFLTMKGFETGNLNARIELNTGKTSQPQRLQPKQIRDQ